MSNPKRKELCLTQDVDSYMFSYVTLDETIAYLMELREQTNGEARLDFEVTQSYCDDYSIRCELTHRRMETDEEYKKRCAEHHKRAAAARKAAKTKKAKQEQEERDTLAKLKAKYEA